MNTRLAMKAAMAGFFGAILASGACWAADGTVLKEEKDRINYSVGYQIGGDFKKQGVDLAPEALVQGIRDALADASPLMTPEEMRTSLVELKKRIVAEQERQRIEATEKYRGEGREFLAGNAKKEGVVTLPSGLQYKVLKEGTGKSPTPQDTVSVRYHGTLLDGSEFDSSERDGGTSTFALADVIPGWQQALPLMKEGAKWRLFVPADLAFGGRGPLADRTVIYEVELLSVKPTE